MVLYWGGEENGNYQLKRLYKTICLQSEEHSKLMSPNFSPHTSEEWGVIGVERNMKGGMSSKPTLFLVYLYILALFELFYDINTMHVYTIYVIFK